MFKLKCKILGLTISLIIMLVFFNSCTRSSKSLVKATQAIDENPAIPDSSISESNEDLFNVNYKDFYNELSGHGKWIQVNGKDFGITPKDTALHQIDNKASFLSNVFGIKTAYAETSEDVDVDFGMFFVWQPDPDLAVAVSVGNEPPVYEPYTNGQWVYTDDGWYFDGATPYEDVTFHYGRWVYNPYAGWVWVPGRVWAPAWVDWYDDDDYISWTPIPPQCYFVDDELSFRPYYYYDDDRYFVCDKRHFCDPDVYRYRTYYRDNGDRIWVHDLKRGDGLVVRKNLVIDPGPGITGIENRTGRKIDPVSVYRTNDRTEAGLNGNQLKSYSPQFSRVKNSERMNANNNPKEYVNYNKAANEFNRTSNIRNNQSNNIAGENNPKGNNKWNVLGNQKENTSKNLSTQNSSNSQSRNNKQYSGNNKNNNSQDRFSRKVPKNTSGNKNNNNLKKGSNNNYSGNSKRKNNSSSGPSKNSSHNVNRNTGKNNNSNNGSSNSSPRNNVSHNNGSHNNGGNNNRSGRSNNPPQNKGNNRQKK